MAYTVLARRYRSTSFDELVGQEPVARTLKNAIATGRVAHAYLFTGTRGVGKTSMARIFARALNAPDTIKGCPKLPGEEKNYPPKDVQQRMADAIMKGEDLNVIEIDGASNNSVDDARQLIANAGLTPSSGAMFKIYIIDEVHMLSASAFNALLKTMEEPPSHVKFILCTTESHKVMATIQSRCQRFDFRNIPTARIAEHLRSVLKQEKIDAEEEVVWQVARLGNGSMRDALSLMDRLTATTERPLTVSTLVEMLGLPPQQLVRQVVDAIGSGNVAGALRATGDLLNTGISQDQLMDVLIERFRQLMLVTTCGPDSDLIEMSAEEKKDAADQAVKFDAAGLVYMIALCDAALRHGKNSSNPRAVLDAVIVRLALAEKMADVTGLLSGAASGAASGVEKKKPAQTPARR
jgi:DNA polymerase-3 subunit gamma/tau